MFKKVTTTIRRSPFNGVGASEALRMSLGLTLTGNQVTVVFVEDGVYLLTASDITAIGYPDVKRHIQTLRELGCQVVARQEDLETRGILAQRIEAVVRDQKEIDEIIEQSDQVISF